jgi:hypothetical protein
MRRFTCLVFAVVLSGAPAAAAIFTVTTTADSGAGSLRQAILDANASPGADTIAFAIPGAGVQTIVLASALPPVTDVVTIDGYTQAGSSPNTLPLDQGSNAVLNVEVSGAAVTADTCLVYAADGGRIQGLTLNRCPLGTLQATGSVTIAGNFIGTTPAGTPLTDGAPQNRGVYAYGGLTAGAAITVTIGGPNPAERNVIAGHTAFSLSEGIRVYNFVNAVIQGNLIGVDASDSYAIANGVGIFCSSPGPVTIGGSGPNDGNVVAGSLAMGIHLSTSLAPYFVRGNFIGTNAAETRALGNAGGGIDVVAGQPVLIGGTNTGEANVIAYSGGGGFNTLPGGITVSGLSPVAIRGNRFYGNIVSAIALDPLVTPTPNDPGDGDTGPNGKQNTPLITAIDYGPPTVVHATLNSTPSTTFDVDFFANPPCLPRPTAYGQGQAYVGATPVTTDGSGNAAFTFMLPSPLLPGQSVSATATDPAGNTSEFSQTILLRVSPRSGDAAGGASVTLSGQAIEVGATVAVGGVAASSVAVTPPSTITATMPAFDPGTFHDVVVTNPGGLVGTLTNGWVADFTDVPPANIFHDDIVKLVANEVTVGIGGGLYGVDDPVKRQAMAVFVLKAEHGVCYTPPPCTPPGVFADVACPSTFADWIEAMAAEGITGGCGSGNYCPLNTVRRDQMAPFLLKAVHGPAFVPPSCAGIFDDVVCPSLFADWIEELKTEGVTSGCGNGTIYCPSNPNTRGQMATFLAKALRLP